MKLLAIIFIVSLSTLAQTVTLNCPTGYCPCPANAPVANGINFKKTQITCIPTPPPVMYVLTVNSGTGSGSYVVGAVVTIVASAPPSGQVFNKWSGAVVANAASATTTLTMPAAAATVTATYAPAPAAQVVLPVEVIGADGFTQTTQFTVPSTTSLGGITTLTMRVHGVKYETEASFRLNGCAWQPITTAQVAIQGLAGQYYSGIGGGFSTLDIWASLPAGCLVTGTNTLLWRFNGTDGITSGFRVLGFNVLDTTGAAQIPASFFVWDDPTKWQPPLNDAADIAAGKVAFQTASLQNSQISPGNIQAHCGDCHAQDGRDLAYFNYSNLSVIARSQFHGLTSLQAQQIASYIRSLQPQLTVCPNARPWNPPYQPGPSLDSGPGACWAAGVGVNGVLTSDAAMLPILAPGGSTTGWVASAYLNPRETPLALQLPDWNSWLPKIHPIDGFGATFTGNSCATLYTKIAGELQPNSVAAYQGARFDIPAWSTACNAMLVPFENPPTWTTTLSQSIYSVAQWQMVKSWELNQQFGLEGMPQAIFGTKANLRSWDSLQPFLTSPTMLHLPVGFGLGNGTQEANLYLSMIWYQVQMMLHDGQGQQNDHSPMDYSYVQGRIKDLSGAANNAPGAALILEWMVKALQEETLNGPGPDVSMTAGGFSPAAVSPDLLVHGAWAGLWNALCSSPGPCPTQASYVADFARVWFAQISSYTVAQYYAGNDGNGNPWASATEDPQATAFVDNIRRFGGQTWYMLPRMRYIGVDPTLVSQITSWATTVWPSGNWALNASATCTSINNCTSDGQ